ncbi:CCCH zinc finger [Haematococcus lacustris]|uniref:CCCH zinc finger n=1 Tax=Haematococcus lacustris TaxID=44745 RepID=A0A6A0A544_HAELA|nr:CCCH zinc finger [Haematococcus lacustris]
MNANDFTGVNTMMSTCTWNGVTLGGGVTITDDVNLACPARTQTCDDLFNVVYDASNAALASTYNLRSFDHVVYDVPSQQANFPSCSWLAVAVMGGQWIYMNGNCFAGTVMHEMGHNYNLDHSGAYDTDGTVADYGDGSCIMGYQTSDYAPYNANGTGGDIKCFSSPHIYRMGLANYPPGTSLVVRIKSMSADRSNITVDICAKSSSQTCAFANDFNGVGPEYLRLRTTANPTWCLAVCSTAAGTECQPAGWAVGQQRAVVLKRNGCTDTDDWSLWSVVGSSLRNKATGWCMDASLIGSYDAGWGQPIVAK